MGSSSTLPDAALRLGVRWLSRGCRPETLRKCEMQEYLLWNISYLSRGSPYSFLGASLLPLPMGDVTSHARLSAVGKYSSPNIWTEALPDGHDAHRIDQKTPLDADVYLCIFMYVSQIILNMSDTDT